MDSVLLETFLTQNEQGRDYIKYSIAPDVWVSSRQMPQNLCPERFKGLSKQIHIHTKNSYK